MMDQSSEVDVALDEPTDERIERAVQLANSIIWDDRPVEVRQVTQEEAARLPLRKESTRSGELRIIEIEGFDLTPCGGTHVRRTGEVGLVAVRHWERARGLTRIEFIAGNRARADYDRANRTARAVAALFSAGRDDAPALVSRLQEEHKQLLRRVRVLEETTTRVEAEELLAATSVRSDGVRIIARNFEGRDAESLKRLAQAIIAHPRSVALLGSSDEGAARLVFARSADGVGDMNGLMREACALLDGRGGGRPDLAQGGGHHVEKISEAIAAAARILHTD
jgi:alanyl-tRNA synthetase